MKVHGVSRCLLWLAHGEWHVPISDIMVALKVADVDRRNVSPVT